MNVNVNAVVFFDKEYVIVRTFSAGVFSGYVKSRDGREVVMNKARPLWYW
jgi:hypothetical protein